MGYSKQGFNVSRPKVWRYVLSEGTMSIPVSNKGKSGELSIFEEASAL